ncbi:conserved hypothetical protein [Paracoccus halophilus]|uniref:Membrane protein n=1 Tax=Paracoccus halophilus TaxID=376733 RepID=A0A099F6B4_9RHOB|nr:TIGR02186 family protein [Paracoccus halophilus]KGJ05803.1 membrane protein [Paracoccus halophilus]SFA41032.1 conserved hypothetical protein [Paracoccus halophilus]
MTRPLVPLLLTALLAIALPARAQDAAPESPEKEPPEKIVAGISRENIDITTSFDGSEIIIYGAVKRQAPIPADDPLDVVVAVAGPSEAVTVRHKERKLGVWVNTGRVDIGAAPNFYVIASTRPLHLILTPQQDQVHRISVPLVMRSFAGPLEVEDAVPYTEALVRLRQNSGYYRQDNGAVRLVENTLFRADVRLPSNLIEGAYSARIFLLRGGEVLDTFRAPIEVRKVGLERWLYRLALEYPFVYGIMSLAIAIAAGWGASAAFRQFRRN